MSWIVLKINKAWQELCMNATNTAYSYIIYTYIYLCHNCRLDICCHYLSICAIRLYFILFISIADMAINMIMVIIVVVWTVYSEQRPDTNLKHIIFNFLTKRNTNCELKLIFSFQSCTYRATTVCCSVAKSTSLWCVFMMWCGYDSRLSVLFILTHTCIYTWWLINFYFYFCK